MNIIAVRHTSVEVPAGICYGQTDIKTTSAYESERNAVSQKLLPETFQAVYSSPLSRCQKLAEYISKGIPVIYDSRLLELNFGKWEGVSWNYISHTEEGHLWFSNWLHTPCPEGESYQQLIIRIQEFIQQVHRVHKDKNILIVTHSGIIRAMISLLSDLEPRKAFDINIEYGSITKLNVHE